MINLARLKERVEKDENISTELTSQIISVIGVVEILSAACEKIENPRKRDHVEPDYQTRYYCLMNIANEALELAAKKIENL